MYTITGVYGIKIEPVTGQFLRMKKVFTQTVNTDQGVFNFIEDNKPFAEFKVVDAITKKDVTDEFIGES